MFTIQVEDALGNQGGTFAQGQYVEVYNTDTPPAAPAPSEIHASTQAGGVIKVWWSKVDLADSYNVYRSAGNCDTDPDTLVASNVTDLFVEDLPPADGIYCYGVTSLRRGAESVLSGKVGMLSDRTPPGAPEGVNATLGPDGVQISWAPSSGEAPYRYRIYRNGALIREVSGVLTYTDHPGIGGTYEYVVASRDSAGNENPSDSATINLTVGAVTNLLVTVDLNGVPVLSWGNSDPTVVGFNVYRGGVKLNDHLIPITVFEDEFYSRSSVVEYKVTAVNGNGDESPARVVRVWPFDLSVVPNPDDTGAPQPLVLGYFDTYDVRMSNLDTSVPLMLDGLEYRMTAGSVELAAIEKAISQTIVPGGIYESSMVIPAGNVEDDHILRLSFIDEYPDGSKVKYTSLFRFQDVVWPDFGVDLSLDSIPIAGGYTTATVCFTNHGMAPMDIIASRNSGSQPGDIYVAVETTDGVEISRGWYKGFPSGAYYLADGTAFMRLDYGARSCVDVQVLVPANIPDNTQLVFRGGASTIYYRVGSDDQVTSAGISGTYLSATTKTPYYGQAQADKDLYRDTDVVHITGQAIDRLTGDPKPNVPLKLGFNSRGYKWYRDVTTDANGSFSYDYNPPQGLSGHFMIWAAHPDVYDTLRQDEFDVYRLYALSGAAEVRMSRQDPIHFTVDLYNPGDRALTGFTAVAHAYVVDTNDTRTEIDTITGRVDFGTGPFTLGPGERRSVTFELNATLDAPDHALVEFELSSAQGASVLFQATVSVLPAIPVLTVEEPAAGYVDVRVDRGTIVSKSITVKNTGLKDLKDVVLIPPQTITWMRTNLPTDANGTIRLGDIPVGESRTFDVVFTPPDDTEFGYHQDQLVLRGSNYAQDFTINLYAMVTSNKLGSVKFVVKDMTGQVVEGATIRMRNGAIQQEIEPVTTDFNGEALITGLQEGEWSWQVTAPGHSASTDTVTVIPDQTVSVEPIMYRSLVTVEFTVEPVPFTDRYEIKIEQTFETHVPAPVLVLDPPQFTFNDVQDGFEANLIVKAKNFGLIELHDVTITKAHTPWGDMTPLIEYIPSLMPMEEVEVPFKLVFRGDSAAQTLNSMMQAKFDVPGYVDCVLGGFGGMMDAIRTLYNVFSGYGSCYGNANLHVAVGLLVFLHIWNAPRSLQDILVNIVLCAAQQLNIGSGGGGTAGPGGPCTSCGYYGYGGGIPCFARGTPILMADRTMKPIEDVKVGDEVMSFTGEPDRVIRVHKRQSDHVRELWVSNQKGEKRRILTTDHHLFWAGDGKWVPARLLKVGTTVYGPDKAAWRVVENIRRDEAQTVYNLDVTKYHSYFANGILVHERCGNLEDDPVGATYGERTRVEEVTK